MSEATTREQAEYRRLDRWRSAWQALAAKHEQGRLQVRQERIERRALLCNQKIHALMRAFDRRVGNTFCPV